MPWVPGFPDSTLAGSLASPTARNRAGNWVSNRNNSVTSAGGDRRRIPGVPASTSHAPLLAIVPLLRVSLTSAAARQNSVSNFNTLT